MVSVRVGDSVTMVATPFRPVVYTWPVSWAKISVAARGWLVFRLWMVRVRVFWALTQVQSKVKKSRVRARAGHWAWLGEIPDSALPRPGLSQGCSPCENLTLEGRQTLEAVRFLL
jgi:hypothetical protein